MSTESDKTTEAIIHLCNLSIDDPDLERSKLVKLMYYADAESFADHGEPVTDITYLHFPDGPLPDGWYKIVRRMEQNGDITVIHDTSQVGYHNYKIIANRPADLEYLSPTDCQHLARQVERFAHQNPPGMTYYAQQGAAWLATEDGQPMGF